MNSKHVVTLLALVIVSIVICEEAVPKGFQEPVLSDASKIAFVDTFQSDPNSNGWVASQSSKYTGQEWRWSEAPGTITGLSGDKGIIAAKEAQHYAYAHAVNVDTKDKEFVFQYEVKYEKNMQCGGSYVKLLAKTDDLRLESFDDKSPYVIMFGPDYCQPTDKVHFIFRHYNPIADKWEEKHLKNPPLIKNDQFSHLYTLIIRPDNSFEILIDNESARRGNLLEDFDPPVIPPKEIDDPTDSKPKDWVDEEQIDDLSATKPEDWDENEPLEIPDQDDKKPETWLDDEPARVPDPNSKKPEDWNDEEDGKWEAPLVENEKCKQFGCGEWKPRMVRNPKYKGKWRAPKIKNPAYKGPWKARQIPNPNYFEDLHPHNLPVIGAIAFEIWTVQNGIMFDNVLIGHDAAVAKDFAMQTWAKKIEVQKLQAPKATENPLGGIFDRVKEVISNYPIPIIATTLAILITIPFLCCRGGSTAAAPRAQQGEESKSEETDENDKITEEPAVAQKKEEEPEKEEEPKVEEEIVAKEEAKPKKRKSNTTRKE